MEADNGVTTTTVGHLDFNIVNLGSAPQDLSKITLKYFYLAGTILTNPQVTCLSTSIGACSAVTPSYGAFTPSKPNADARFKLSFAGVTLPAGGALAIHVTFQNNPSATFDETKDYSYTAADKTFTDAPNITLYDNGTLIWGTQP
jgi:hypothetical protein